MQGSVKERAPGVWLLRVYLGRDSKGRVKHASKTFKGGKRAAERELSRMVAEQSEMRAAEPVAKELDWGPSTTINEAIEGWRRNGWQDLSPNTVRGYEGVWERYVRNGIGRRTIVSCGPYDFERLYRDLKAAGCGQTTVRLTRALLHRSCRLARKWSGNRLPNPVADTEMPSWALEEQPQAVRAPRLEEVHALLSGARAIDPRIAVLVRVIAATGMRRGEACALRWNDVDDAAGSLIIDEGVVAVAGSAYAKSPKTRASRRRVGVDAGTLRELRALRAEQEKVAAECGMSVGASSFVFSFEPAGEVPPHPDTMSHGFGRLRDKVGVSKDVYLHSLRHFQATVLDAVIPEAQKQARLGWSTVHMARHYTDSVDELDRRAAEHVGRLMEVPGFPESGGKET